MSNELGWRGKRVRHLDGREGTISREDTGFLHVALTIEASDGTSARVQLNANSSDSGAQGWAWYCPEFSGGAAWLPLGDHNSFVTVRDAAEDASPAVAGAQEADEHDKWFRAEVRAAIKEADDPNTEWVTHEEAKSEWAQQRETLQARIAKSKLP